MTEHNNFFFKFVFQNALREINIYTIIIAEKIQANFRESYQHLMQKRIVLSN